MSWFCTSYPLLRCHHSHFTPEFGPGRVIKPWDKTEMPLQSNKAGFPIYPKHQQVNLCAACYAMGNSLFCVELTSGMHVKGEGTVHEAPAEKIRSVLLPAAYIPWAAQSYKDSCPMGTRGQHRPSTVLVQHVCMVQTNPVKSGSGSYWRKLAGTLLFLFRGSLFQPNGSTILI